MTPVRKHSDQRVRDLAAIHVGKKQLGLDQDTYRALLLRVAGVASAADLDADGRRAVRAELARLGAGHPAQRTRRGKARAGQYPGKPRNFDSSAMPEMITRVEQLLTAMGLAWAYADAISMHMYGVERVAWLRDPSQLRGIIAALYAEQKKRDLLESVESMRQELRLDAKEWQALTGHLPTGWTRNAGQLKALAAVLDARVIKLRQLEA